MSNGFNSQADDVVVSVSNYELPPAGSHQAVCVDVIDLGEVDTAFGPTPKLAIVWQITPDPDTGADVARTDGERFEVARRFGANLSERGHLRPFLETWRGKKFTKEELAGFHLRNLVGANALLQVVHEEKGEKTYCNVTAITPWLKKFGEPIQPSNYVRRIKRPDQQQPRPTREEAHAATAAQAPSQRRTGHDGLHEEFDGDPWQGEAL